MSHRALQESDASNVHPKVVFAPSTWQASPHSPVSRNPSRVASRETSITTSSRNGSASHSNGRAAVRASSADGYCSDFDSDNDDMGDRRPPLHRPTDGRSHQPLLGKDDDEERGRTGYETSVDGERPPIFSRRSTMRSRSPDTQAKLATRKKYTYAAFFLGLSLISFVVQTETAVYIQHTLGWNKAYCML